MDFIFKIGPSAVMMAIIPFKDVLIYDGVIEKFSVKMGSGFEDIILKDLSKSIKYYHL